MSDSDRYHVAVEMLAAESVDGNALDPDRDVPFAALWETHETLARLGGG